MKDRDDATRLRETLAEVASRRETITYRQLAQSLGLEPPGVIRRVAALLEASMAEDASAGRPFAAAMVVSRTEGMPRRGFFQRAAELGRFHGNQDGPDARAYFEAERRAARSYWSKNH